MRRVYKSLIFAAIALVAASCVQNSLDADMNVDRNSVTIEVFMPTNVKTTLGPDYTPLWKTGDRIWVSDGEHICCSTVSSEYNGLPAAKIEAEGLTEGSKYYVAYPYSDEIKVVNDVIVLPVPIVQTGKFEDANICSGIIPEGGTSANLQNRTAILKFQFADDECAALELDCQSSAITGLASEPQSKVNSKCPTGGVAYVSCLPGTMSPGARLYFVTRDGRIGSVVSSREHTLAAGTIYDMSGTVDGVSYGTESAVDLSAPGTANCYIVPGPGTYKIKASEGISNRLLDRLAFTRIVWETVNTSTAPSKYSIVKECALYGGYLYFKIPGTAPDGNALIAACDEKGNILWSWHLWVLKNGVTDQTLTGYSGAVMLDRNIGALDNSLEVKGFGMMYQQGRKDPFPSPSSASSGTNFAKVTGTPISTVNMTDTTGTLNYANSHPYMYIISDSDWNTDTSEGLWDATEKTNNDPCPYGYHIPYRSALDGLPAGNWYPVSGTTTRGYQYALNTSTILRFPATGFRSKSTGNTSNFSYGYYWFDLNTGSGNATKFVKSTAVASTSLYKGSGAPIRCQKNTTTGACCFKYTINVGAGAFLWSPFAKSDESYSEAYIVWGDDSDKETIPIGSAKSHTYSAPGTYTISVDTYQAFEVVLPSLGGVTTIDLSNL